MLVVVSIFSKLTHYHFNEYLKNNFIGILIFCFPTLSFLKYNFYFFVPKI